MLFGKDLCDKVEDKVRGKHYSVRTIDNMLEISELRFQHYKIIGSSGSKYCYHIAEEREDWQIRDNLYNVELSRHLRLCMARVAVTATLTSFTLSMGN